MPHDFSDDDYEQLAMMTLGLSTAELINMCREGGMRCIRRNLDKLTIKTILE